jgi:hypothetical protein
MAADPAAARGGKIMATSTKRRVGRAQAAPVTFEFTGTVTGSDFDTIPVGSAVTGSYTFDSALQNQSDIPNFGVYRPVELEMHFVAGTSVVTSTAAIQISSRKDAPAFDSYEVSITDPVTLTGSFAGVGWQFGHLLRADSTGTAFDGASLPLTPPDLDSLPIDQSVVTLGHSSFASAVSFTLASLSLATSDADGDRGRR